MNDDELLLRVVCSLFLLSVFSHLHVGFFASLRVRDAWLTEFFRSFATMYPHSKFFAVLNVSVFCHYVFDIMFDCYC